MSRLIPRHLKNSCELAPVCCVTMLTAVPVGIKQETNILDGLDLDSMLQAATKRPFDGNTNGDESSKRVKTETEPAHDNAFEPDPGAEESLEDGLALLVQNALNNVGDLVSQFTQDANMAQTTNDPMDVDPAPIPEASLPPPPVTFLSDPQKYLRKASRHALGNMVGWRDYVPRPSAYTTGIGSLCPPLVLAILRRLNKADPRCGIATRQGFPEPADLL
jgi:hypothetical protein